MSSKHFMGYPTSFKGLDNQAIWFNEATGMFHAINQEYPIDVKDYTDSMARARGKWLKMDTESKHENKYYGYPVRPRIIAGEIWFDLERGFFHEVGENLPLVHSELTEGMKFVLDCWKDDFQNNKKDGLAYPLNTPVDDDVNHPSHYNTGEIEVLEYLTDKFGLPYVLGTLSKYAPRAGKKDDLLKDVSKIVFYAIWAQEVVLAAAENRNRCKPNELMSKFKERA